MIKQNKTIAERIIARQKEFENLLKLLLSLSVEEWEEYLLFILYVNHDSRTKTSNFLFERKYEFLFKLGNDRGADTFGETFSIFNDTAGPTEKGKLSEAVNNLIKKYVVTEKVFIETLMCTISYYFQYHDKGPVMGTFTFEGLKAVCDTEKISIVVKRDALYMMGQLVGIQQPTRSVLLTALLQYRDLFRRDDETLHIIMYTFLNDGFFEEALYTFTFLSSKWPQAFNVEQKITGIFRHNHESVIGKKVELIPTVEKILPGLATPIKKKLIKLLKNSCYEMKDFTNARSLVKTKFPATLEELEFIENL